MGFWTSKTFWYRLAIGVSVSCLIDLWKMYYYDKKRKSIESERRTKLYTFAPDPEKCRAHAFKSDMGPCNSLDCPVRKLNEIVDVIKSSKTSLDVCVYFLTNYEIGEAIIDAFNRNVVVRVITDHTMSQENVERIVKLRREGIKIRTMKSVDALMHHKFAVVDKTTLICGSANWTANAFVRNYEHIFVTNEPSLLDGLSAEFNRLWQIFDA